MVVGGCLRNQLLFNYTPRWMSLCIFRNLIFTCILSLCRLNPQNSQKFYFTAFALSVMMPNEPLKVGCKCPRQLFQACEGAPSFQFYSSFHFELRRRVLKLFQQAARKVRSAKSTRYMWKTHTRARAFSQMHKYIHTYTTHTFFPHFAKREGLSLWPCPFSPAMCEHLTLYVCYVFLGTLPSSEG